MRILKNSQGVTIVELLVTIVIFSLVITVVGNYAVSNMSQIAVQNAHAELINDAQVSLDVMTTDIKLAGGAQQNNRWPDNNAPNAPSNLYSWSSSTNVLILSSPTIDNAKNIVYSDPAQYISEKDDKIYFLVNGELRKRIIAANVSGNRAKTTCPEALATTSCPKDKVLLKNVSSISIRYINNAGDDVSSYDARAVELTVNLSISKYNKPINITYKSRAVFRNV